MKKKNDAPKWAMGLTSKLQGRYAVLKLTFKVFEI